MCFIIGGIIVCIILGFLMGRKNAISGAVLEERKKYEREVMLVNEEYKVKQELLNKEYEEKNKELQAEYQKKLDECKKIEDFLVEFKSNLTAIPYMAGMIADIETYGLEDLARGLDWGRSYKRYEKVKAIREIRKDAREMVEKNKNAQYQLAYLLEIFPELVDVIDTEFDKLPIVKVEALPEHDGVKDYLSREEYLSLSETERNQLALDRYNESHKKSKWQIGRDYELYVGYKYSQKGYKIDNYGAKMGLEDLGRDIIAKKRGSVLIIQCKYWSSTKLIHEKHVTQLYGTMVSYCIENNLDKEKVNGVLVTNIKLSDMAKKMAEYLNITYVENYKMHEYPCIKCNIGKDEFGNKTKIYHLPFDQQYDATEISGKDEFYAMTVAEAEAAGFRRAFKWYG